MSDQHKIFKHELVEVVIPAGSIATKYQFPDVQNLRDKHLLGIDAYTARFVPRSILSQNDVITEDVAAQSYLTLELYNGKNFLNQMPLPSFIGMEVSEDPDNTFNRYKRDFVGQKINWPKCFIEVTDGFVQSDVPRSYLFSVWYRESMQIEEQDLASSFGRRK